MVNQMTKHIYVDNSALRSEGWRGNDDIYHAVTNLYRNSFGSACFSLPSAKAANADALTREKVSHEEIIISEMLKTSRAGFNKDGDEFLLVAADEKYAPMVRHLNESGFWVDVAFWSSASAALKNAGTRFIELDKHFEKLKVDSNAQADAQEN